MKRTSQLPSENRIRVPVVPLPTRLYRTEILPAEYGRTGARVIGTHKFFLKRVLERLGPVRETRVEGQALRPIRG